MNNIEKLRALIKTTEPSVLDRFGPMFKVTFVKANGQLRTYRARLGMERNLKGGVNHLTDPKYMTVWSADSQGYRALNLETVTELMLPDGKRHLVKVNIPKV
jgi:hypothetical protein